MAGRQTPGTVNVRPLNGHDEFAQAVDLQRIIWKFGELELLPVRFFVVASRIGGQTLGAFDAGRMVGFCLAIPGIKPDGCKYLHSHMLGVLSDYRNAGVGRILKDEQRRDALERGLDLIEWTFDPFEVKNAYFNIERLGAVVSQYVRNMYGTTSSPLHAGLPTDRCVAQWWIAQTPENPLAGARGSESAAYGYSNLLSRDRKGADAHLRKVEVSSQRSAAAQEKMAAGFRAAFDEGLVVTGFERRENGGAYLFGPWPSK